jgi:hypothetical protein
MRCTLPFNHRTNAPAVARACRSVRFSFVDPLSETRSLLGGRVIDASNRAAPTLGAGALVRTLILACEVFNLSRIDWDRNAPGATLSGQRTGFLEASPRLGAIPTRLSAARQTSDDLNRLPCSRRQNQHLRLRRELNCVQLARDCLSPAATFCELAAAHPAHSATDLRCSPRGAENTEKRDVTLDGTMPIAPSFHRTAHGGRSIPTLTLSTTLRIAQWQCMNVSTSPKRARYE